MKTTKEMKAEVKKISSVEDLKKYIDEIYSNKEEYGVKTKNDVVMIMVWLLQDEINELRRSI